MTKYGKMSTIGHITKEVAITDQQTLKQLFASRYLPYLLINELVAGIDGKNRYWKSKV